MEALHEFLLHPFVLLICFVAAICTLHEWLRYQLGWKQGIIGYLRPRSQQLPETTAEPSHQTSTPPRLLPTIAPEIADRVHQEASKGNDKDFADYIKRALVHRYDGYGDQARYDYFFERMNAAPEGDLHRVAFLHLADRRDFVGLAEGLKTWCKIGFDTIVHQSPQYNNPSTMNRLYIALLKELQGIDLHATGSRDFAYAWAELVREYRADGN